MANVSKSGEHKSSSSKKSTLLGMKTRYIGALGATTTCPHCGRIHHSGMLSQYQNELYCGEDCIKMKLASE